MTSSRANVLLAVDGPRVIDFGISRAVEAVAVTATGAMFGTPGYMSPEQAEGKPASPASDVFALGCVIAYAATGSRRSAKGYPGQLSCTAWSIPSPHWIGYSP